MNRPYSLIKNLFTFELFFFLFLFAGRYKGDPRFSWVPVDLTALFLGISILAAIYIFFVHDFTFRPSALKLNAIYLAFVIYALATLIWTPGEIYAKEKTLHMATLTFWPLLATSLIISTSYERLQRFFMIFIIFALWMAVETFMIYQSAEGWRVSALGNNYLGIGRVLGPAALIVLMYILFYSSSLIVRTLGVATFGFFLYVQLITGGRGPLLATLIPMLLPLFAGIKLNAQGEVSFKRSFSFLSILVAAAVLGMVYFMNTENAPTTLRRLNELFTESGGGGSAQTRASFFITSLNLWVYQPIWGYGVGSWPVIVEFMDYQYYPHNIVIETMFEFGLIGLALLAALFFYGIRQLGAWKTIRNSPLKLLVLMIFLNTLLNASVSGDIPTNRFLFGALGLLMLRKDVYITSRFKRSTGYYI